MQRVQQTCRRFHELLANPVCSTVWGKVVLLSHRFQDDISSDVQQLCGWVQRRSKGESSWVLLQYEGMQNWSACNISSTTKHHILVNPERAAMCRY